MSVIANLIEETNKLDKSSRRNLEPAIIEIAGIETTIQALIDIALELQEQLSNMIVFHVDFTLPPGEEKTEPVAREESGDHYQITDYTINIGPVTIYSIDSALGNAFAKFEEQTAGMSDIYNPHTFLEALPAIPLESIRTEQKISTNEISDYVKSFFSVVGNTSSTFHTKVSEAQKVADISALKNISVGTSGLPGLAGKGMPSVVDAPSATQVQSIQETHEITDHVGDFSEYIDKVSTVLHTKVSKAQEVADILAFKNISVGTSGLPSLMGKGMPSAVGEPLAIPVQSVQETHEITDHVGDISEYIDKVSTVLHTKVSEAQKVADISVLKNISVETLGLPGLIEKGLPSAAYTGQKTGGQKTGGQKTGEISDHIGDFSEYVDRISTTLHTKVSEAKEVADIPALKNISVGTSGLPRLIEKGQPSLAYPGQKTHEITDHVGDFSEYVDRISTTLHTKVSEAKEVADIPALKNISVGTSGLPGLVGKSQPSLVEEPHAVSVQSGQETREITDHVGDFSEYVDRISTTLHTKVSEAQEVADIPALKSISVETSGLPGLSEKGQPSIVDEPSAIGVQSGQDKREITDHIGDFSEYIDKISTVLHKKVSEAQEVADIPALKSISIEPSGLPGLPGLPGWIEKGQPSAAYSGQKPGEISDHVGDFSEYVDKVSTVLHTKVSEAQEAANIPALKSISVETLGLPGLVGKGQPSVVDESHAVPVQPGQETREITDHVGDFSEYVDKVSTVLHTKVSEAQKIADISALRSISVGTSGLPGVIEKEQSSAPYIGQKTGGITDHVDDFSEYINNVSTALHTKVSEAQEVADISALKNISVETSGLPGLIEKGKPAPVAGPSAAPLHPGQETGEITDHIGNFSEYIDKVSTVLHTKVSEAQEVADISALKNISVNVPSSAVSSKKEQHPPIYSGHNVIEVPAFMPGGKVFTQAEESAINSTRLTGAIADEYHVSDESRSAPSSSLISVANAFETVSDYITIASEIDSHMSEMTEENGQVANNIIEPFNLLMKGNDAGAALTLDRITSGGAISAEQPVMDVALSMATTGALQKAGSSAIRDIAAAVPPSESGIRGPPAPSVPRAMENILQIISGQSKETAVAAPVGGSTAHFHNSFNIAVNVKGGGDESELRDLGRKIGLILSDEIKRYGGIR